MVTISDGNTVSVGVHADSGLGAKVEIEAASAAPEVLGSLQILRHVADHSLVERRHHAPLRGKPQPEQIGELGWALLKHLVGVVDALLRLMTFWSSSVATATP